MKKETTIYFYYAKEERGKADVLDTYNWIKENDTKLAERFKAKSDKAIRIMKKRIKEQEILVESFGQLNWDTTNKNLDETINKTKTWWKFWTN